MPTLNVENATLYYEVHGNGYPLFFIHGGGGNTLAFFQQVPFFAKDYKVVTVDLRGFKNSRCEPEFAHPKYFPNDIRAIMAAEGISRAALVCQSLGAWAGLPLAVRNPELVSCIAINGSPTPAYSHENWRVLRASGDTFNAGRMGRSGAIGWAKTFPAKDPARYFLYAQLKELNAPFDARKMQEDVVKLHPKDFANYNVPTLITGGSHDDFLTPDHHLHVATLIPGATTHTFPNAGHSAYFETPDEFNEIFLQFLERHKNH